MAVRTSNILAARGMWRRMINVPGCAMLTDYSCCRCYQNGMSTGGIIMNEGLNRCSHWVPGEWTRW
jgi:hypothetical protein